MSQNVAYYSSVTEHESGWGCRPDGYVVALTREAFDQKAKSINSQTGHEFSLVDSAAKLCLITDEFAEELKEKGCVWIFKNTKEWLVEG